MRQEHARGAAGEDDCSKMKAIHGSLPGRTVNGRTGPMFRPARTAAGEGAQSRLMRRKLQTRKAIASKPARTGSKRCSAMTPARW